MFKVKTILLALMLRQVAAETTTDSGLRAFPGRRLNEEKFLSYEPATTVTDHAAIDLDQKALEEQLALGTNEGRAKALKVYQEGAFSKSYAEVALDSALLVDLAKGVSVFGQASDGTPVRGKTAAAFKTGDTIIQVEYHSSPQQATWTNCHVGGNPNPNTKGCFKEIGSLEIGELGNFPYKYSITEDNMNARTLQEFSMHAKQKMYECGSRCPYKTYNKFYEYYGVFDYANQWVLAAFNKGGTNFAKGNAEFNVYGMEGTMEAIKKGTSYMNVWMYVYRMMELAISDCETKCNGDACNDDQIHAWDEAVALYTGSIPKSSGEGGYLLYTLAQKRCENFGTCFTDTSEVGMAKVNSEVFQNFRLGKQDLLKGDCKAVEKNVARIAELMAVPLIQGTLRYAYVQDKQNDDREKAQAEGATFAAAVLPLVNACSAADADIIYNNMRVGNGGGASFEVVKKAFERNYNCMGITCEDVGGLVDQVSEGYLKGAEPCGYVGPSQPQPMPTPAPVFKPTPVGSKPIKPGTTTTASSGSSSSSSSSTPKKSTDSGPNVGLAVGLTMGIVAGLIILALIVSRKKDDREYDGVAEPEMT